MWGGGEGGPTKNLKINKWGGRTVTWNWALG